MLSLTQDSLLRLLYLLVPATLHARLGGFGRLRGERALTLANLWTFPRDDAGWLPEHVAEAHGWESTARLLKFLPAVQCDDPGSADDTNDDVEQAGHGERCEILLDPLRV